ncbi:FTR1 family protein [Oceanithermus sp.]|uniref:FTR1 family iron permease n=1 Tax=Oceanithermus sp. TaxID=2268145 RepID=UPI002579921F|nr:FTR1 family protein [Oceanithermus sp.]
MNGSRLLFVLLAWAGLAGTALAQTAGWGWGALSGATIVLREGLEAALVLGAVLVYLRAAGAGARLLRGLWGGVAAALLASGAAWWASSLLLGTSEASRQVLEGVTALLAAGVLFFVINWLFHQAYVVDWTDRMRTQARAAVARGSALGLVALGFLVVFREGFETVLFFRALLAQAPAGAVGAGFLAGAAATVGVVVALARSGRRLPLRRAFQVSGWLLLLLAVSFVGNGVHELQEAGWIPETAWWAAAFDHAALKWAGLRGTLETLGSQAAYLLLLAASFTLARRRARRLEARAHGG